MDLFEGTFLEDLVTSVVLVVTVALLWYRSSML